MTGRTLNLVSQPIADRLEKVAAEKVGYIASKAAYYIPLLGDIIMIADGIHRENVANQQMAEEGENLTDLSRDRNVGDDFDFNFCLVIRDGDAGSAQMFAQPGNETIERLEEFNNYLQGMPKKDEHLESLKKQMGLGEHDPLRDVTMTDILRNPKAFQVFISKMPNGVKERIFERS